MKKKSKWKELDVLLFILPYIVSIYILLGSFSLYYSHFNLTNEIFKNIYSGYFPFWNYRYAGGFPFFASGESNIFYFSLLSSNFVTFFWDIIFHFFLSSYFYFKLLKKLELKIKSSFLIIFLYIATGFSLYSLKDINYFHIYHLLPAIAYFLFLQFKKPHFKNLIILNIFLSQIVYSNALSLAIFILVISIILLLKERQVIYSFVSVVIFILLSLPFLLSLKQLLNYSDLSFYTYNFFTKNSFAPAQYTQFFYPSYSKVAFNFLVLPLVLTYIIITRAKQKWLIVLSLISFLIACGKYGFILSLIYYIKPYFIIFAGYEIFFSLFTFFIILLFAFALNYFLKNSFPLKTLRNVYLVLFLILTAIYTQNFAVKQEFFYFTDAKATILYAVGRGWHIVFIFLLINFLTIKYFLKNKYFLKILLVLAFINFLPLFFSFKEYYSNSIMFESLNCKKSICSYYIPGDISKEIKRVYTLNKFPRNEYHFPTLNTVYNLMLKSYVDFIKQSNLNSLKFASVGILERNKSIKRFSTLPIYYLTNNIIYLNNKEEVLAALKTEDIKNKPVIILTENTKQSKNNNQNTCNGVFTLDQSSLNNFSFTVNLKNNCYFVFGQTNYPGWKAYLNHKPLNIYSANYLFQAVEVPKGKHNLIFHFVDENAKLGIKISCFFLSIIILILFFNKNFFYKNNLIC